METRIHGNTSIYVDYFQNKNSLTKNFECFKISISWRVNHSVEMISWIKAQTEMSVLYPAFLFWRRN